MSPVLRQDFFDRWRAELAAVGLAVDTPPAPPATAAEIAALEQRLNRGLPPSYRRFLQQFDGMPVTGASASGLRTADRVGWFRDLEAEWRRTWQESIGPDLADIFELVLMGRGLLVSEPGDAAILLDPDDVDEQTGEWASHHLSNYGAGSHRIGDSFDDALDYLHREFRAAHHPPSLFTSEEDAQVDAIYQDLLVGNLDSYPALDPLTWTNWRAVIIATQVDAFYTAPNAVRDQTNNARQLWTNAGGVGPDIALADPVIQQEIIPLWIVRQYEGKHDPRYELHRAPQPVRDQITTIQHQIDDHTGPTADFSYSPEFDDHVTRARRHLADDDPDQAWATIRSGLPTWTPINSNHVAPVGLYVDHELRTLFLPPDQQAPQYIPHGDLSQPPPMTTNRRYRALPGKKLRSERLLEILRGLRAGTP